MWDRGQKTLGVELSLIERCTLCGAVSCAVCISYAIGIDACVGVDRVGCETGTGSYKEAHLLHLRSLI